MRNLRRNISGFTLIELLVVIGILGILLTIVLIAINPARQFSQANNTKRASDVNTILNAIHQYVADNKGNLPANMPTVANGAVQIQKNGGGVGDICASLSPTYVSLLPVDPKVNNGTAISDCTSAYTTGYNVQVDANGRVTISAPNTDTTVSPNGLIISVTR